VKSASDVSELLDLDGYKSEAGFVPASNVLSLVEQGYWLRCDEYTAKLWNDVPMLFYGKHPISFNQPIITAIGDEWFICRKGKLKNKRLDRLPFENLEFMYFTISDPMYKVTVLLDDPECFVTIDGKSDEEQQYCNWFLERYFSEFEERRVERSDGISCDIPDEYHPLPADPVIRFETIVHHRQVREIRF